MENDLKKRKTILDLFCVLPILVFVISILLVRLHLFSMPMTDIYWSEATDTSTLSDVFNYWKAIAIMIAAGLSVVVLIIAYLNEGVSFKKNFVYIPMLLYCAFVLVSLFFSDYKYFALRGMGEHFEGTIVIIAYVLILFFICNMVDSEKRLKLVIYGVLFVALVLGILGITQFIGHNFLSTPLGQKMMTPNYVLENGINSWDMIDILSAQGEKAYNFAYGKGAVSQTVYSTNNVPMYLNLLLPVFAILFVYSVLHKKGAIAILLLGLYGISICCFFGAHSASGYFGLIIILLAAILTFKNYIKVWVKPIICLVLVSCILLGMLSSRWLPEIKDLFSNVQTYIYADGYPDNYTYENKAGSVFATIDYIITSESQLTFSVNGDPLVLTRDENQGAFVVTDEVGEQLLLRACEDEDGFFEILDNRYHDYLLLSLVKDDNGLYVIIKTFETEWPFLYTDGHFIYRNVVGKFVELSKISHASLIRNYSFGSGRGLIWDTTIPMLPHYLIKGSGADTYVFSYPQNDYATRYSSSNGKNLSLVTDKAHNLYMQYWVNTGLISLLAWLTMVGYYLVGAGKQFRKRGFVDFCDFVNGGIFCGILGFLTVAFFNDGSVNTMPMFYTMLGTGLAINMRDKWPSDAPAVEMSGSDGADPGEGKKKGKKAKAAAEVMPEM